MRFPSFVPVAALVAVVTACSDAAAPESRALAPDAPSRIVNGTPTGSAYPSVGALLFDYDENGRIDGDDLFCTGSLVAPDVFLTAAHCVTSPDAPASAQWYVSFAADLYAKHIDVIAATKVVYDPQYGRSQANLHDLALVFLPKGSTKGMTPLRLPPAGYLDQLAAKGMLAKALFINVGYGNGASRTGIPRFSYDGVRKSSLSEFMGLQPTWLGLLMNTSATGVGGDCYGDSGGPKFLQSDPTMVLATVTTGDMNCRATSWDWRTDSPEARGFLGQYLTRP
jgi:hypothetical protein